MKSKMKAVIVTLTAVAVGLVSGCGSGGGVTGPVAGGASSSPASNPPASPSAGATPEAAALYTANCADCHGALDVSDKKGITVTRLQNAIVNNIGGMGFLSALTAAEQQTIVSGLTPAATTPVTPVSPTDGVALYAANCSGCHGALASSTKKGITLARLQNSITGNVGNMGFLSTLTGVQQQAIVTVLAPAATTPAPAPTPTTDGVALYAANCAGCHGVLASSGKKGITLARLQNSITGNIGNMGFLSTLTNAQQQAIVNVLAVTTPPPTTPTTPVTPVTNGATLYATNCAGCHSALATSEKAGATAARTQTAINNNIGGMGFLSTLTATQVAAIATSLAVVTPPVNPAPTCGSCHALPPATGRHSFHRSRNIACSTCHGAGFSTTAVNAATHNNGVKNLTTTIGWSANNRSCANSCHGSESW